MKIGNKLTTGTGLCAGVALIIEGFQSPGINWTLIIAGVGNVLLGLFAKDFNTTGLPK